MLPSTPQSDTAAFSNTGLDEGQDDEILFSQSDDPFRTLPWDNQPPQRRPWSFPYPSWRNRRVVKQRLLESSKAVFRFLYHCVIADPQDNNLVTRDLVTCLAHLRYCAGGTIWYLRSIGPYLLWAAVSKSFSFILTAFLWIVILLLAAIAELVYGLATKIIRVESSYGNFMFPIFRYKFLRTLSQIDWIILGSLCGPLLIFHTV